MRGELLYYIGLMTGLQPVFLFIWCFSIVSIHKIIQEAFIYETISRRNYWRHRHGRTEICFFVGKPSLVYSNRISGQLPFCRKNISGSGGQPLGNGYTDSAAMKDMIILDAQKDVDKVTALVDFVFCAVDMKKDEIRALEEMYAKAECPVMSNNSAHRWTPDVPWSFRKSIQSISR